MVSKRPAISHAEKSVATITESYEMYILASVLESKAEAGKPVILPYRLRLAAARNMLRSYHHPRNFDKDGKPYTIVPPEMAVFLAGILGDFLAGKMPDPLRALLKKGNFVLPSQEDDAFYAVLYVRSCQAGIIDDKRHIRTVMKWFGLNFPKTIYRWLALPMYKNAHPANFRPDLPASDRAELIVSLAQSSGKHWKAHRLRHPELV